MLYFVKKDKKIKKYLVEVDYEELKNIFEEIQFKNGEAYYIINKLISGDITVIDDIYSFEDKKREIKKQINKLDKELYDAEDNSEFEDRFSTMRNYIKQEKILEVDEQYIEKIKKCLSFKLLDTISKKEVKRINKFFEEKDITTYGKVKVKSIDKKKKK